MEEPQEMTWKHSCSLTALGEEWGEGRDCSTAPAALGSRQGQLCWAPGAGRQFLLVPLLQGRHWLLCQVRPMAKCPAEQKGGHQPPCWPWLPCRQSVVRAQQEQERNCCCTSYSSPEVPLLHENLDELHSSVRHQALSLQVWAQHWVIALGQDVVRGR